MRFLSMVRVQENTGQVPSERLMAEMGKLIEEFSAKGALLDTAGLRPTSEGVRLRNNHGTLSRTDGPFTEAREVVGGFYLIQAKDYDDAMTIVGDCPHLAFGSIEVREIEELQR